MKRPKLVHFLAIMTEEFLCLKAAITLERVADSDEGEPQLKPQMPIQALRLLRAYNFQMKVIGLNSERQEVYKKTFDSDSFGNFNLKIHLNEQRKSIVALQIYEVGKRPGLEIHLGTFIPLSITPPKKLIICDFDKTLVDTRYSTTKEVYYSLTKPLHEFPTIQGSLELLQSYIEKNFHPFILSASPHFYEGAMRDWLYQNKIYTAGIFLKDYRQIFSFYEMDLTPKDLKIQGLYKLNHLLDIILMTGIPQELVLMGDNFESDPIIYLTLAKLLREDLDPWTLWNKLKKFEAFRLNKKQNAQLLSKLYQLNNMLDGHHQSSNVKIFIRKKVDEHKIDVPEFFETQVPNLELYDGHGPALT